MTFRVIHRPRGNRGRRDQRRTSSGEVFVSAERRGTARPQGLALAWRGEIKNFTGIDPL
jgi:hypothetical protein